MRKLMVLVLSSASLVTPTKANPNVNPVSTLGLTSFLTTPLYNNDYSYFVITGSGSKTTSLVVNVELINDLYPSGVNICSYTFTNKTTYTYRYDNAYTYVNNTLKISYKLGTKKSLPITHSIEVVSSRYDLISDNRINSNSSVLMYANGEWKESKEILNFIGFDDQYIPDFYHKIDLSTFKIKTSIVGLNKLEDTTGNLYISNREGSFSGIKQRGKYASIEIKLVESNKLGTYYVQFKENLYVNQFTLEMSDSPKDGFVKTKHLFLPKNEMRYQDEYDCYFQFEHLGIDNVVVPIHFKLNALINTVGDCVNSEYCIIES